DLAPVVVLVLVEVLVECHRLGGEQVAVRAVGVLELVALRVGHRGGGRGGGGVGVAGHRLRPGRQRGAGRVVGRAVETVGDLGAQAVGGGGDVAVGGPRLVLPGYAGPLPERRQPAPGPPSVP